MAGGAADVLSVLREAAQGLTFPSETDAPITAFAVEGTRVEGMAVDAVLQAVGNPSATPVRTISLEHFFQPVTQEQAWHNAQERGTAQRFRKLVEALKASLTDLRVFQVGEVEKDVYVVGKTASGELAGVKTRLVET
jgi:Nuclease A inhibitor-like protein